MSRGRHELPTQPSPGASKRVGRGSSSHLCSVESKARFRLADHLGLKAADPGAEGGRRLGLPWA